MNDELASIDEAYAEPEVTKMRRRPRIMVSTLGRDGPERVTRLIGRLMHGAGLDVVYAGVTVRPEQIVTKAVEAGADAIGLSAPSGVDTSLIALILASLRSETGRNVIVVVVGATSADDIRRLERLGVTAVLRSGGAVEDFATFLRCSIGRVPSEFGEGRLAP